MSTKKSKKFINKTLSPLLQALFFIGLYLALNHWQQSDMLSVDSTLKETKINLLTINGETYHYDFANGHQQTLVYFFAPWCNICHLSIDNLQTIYDNKPDNLTIILIALDWRSITEIEQFLAEHQLTMPILLGTETIQQRFKVNAFPSYYFISAKGKVTAKNKGYTTELGLKVRQALNP